MHDVIATRMKCTIRRLLLAGVVAWMPTTHSMQAQDAIGSTAGSRLLDRISESRTRSMDEALDLETRSAALDECLEARAELMRNTQAGEDSRLASWHADQAEDLLLRRIEFPNSWSTHLFNADRSCPLLPAEIPLLIAQGIEEAGLAARLVEDAIMTLESEESLASNQRDLLDRLRFERDLRIPLLEAIGLILASSIEQDASISALEILDGIKEEVIELNEVRPILDNWKIQAALAIGDRDRLQQLPLELDDGTSTLDRIRITEVLEGPESAARMAAEAFAQADPAQVYERLLLADLHARSLRAARGSATPEQMTDWTDGTIELWLELLQERHPTQEAIDAAIAARLVQCSGNRDPMGMPLAVAWAIGRAELARRSRGEAPRGGTIQRLETTIDATNSGSLVRARALAVLFRLELMEGDRLKAARTGGVLFREHPDAPGADPGLVADLVEPWALSGDEQAGRLYEEALMATLQGPSGTETNRSRPRKQADQMRLARYLLMAGRAMDGLELTAVVDPETEPIAVELIEVRAMSLAELARSRQIEPEALISLQERLDEDGRSYLRKFSADGRTPVSAKLLRMTHAARLTAARSNLSQKHRPEDLKATSLIIERSDLDRDLRIEALFLRNRMRLLDPETRDEVVENAGDIAYALGLDREIAMRHLLEELEVVLELIARERAAGRVLGVERLSKERLRAITKLIIPEDVTRLTVQERMSVARAMGFAGWQEKSIALWDGLAREQPDAWQVLEGRADALAGSREEAELGEAIGIYRRLAQGQPGQFVPESAWWNAQLGQLLVLERVGRSLQRIAPKIERLRLLDPTLGGERFNATFDQLQERVTARLTDEAD